MTIKDVHDWMDFITNKSADVYFSEEEKDMALDRAQMKYFNEQYSTYALAQKIQDSLSPFKTIYPFLTSDTPSGLLNAPADYQYLLGGQVVIMADSHVRNKSLKILSESEIAYRLDSQLRPVTTKDPFATIAGRASGITIIQLYPKTPMAGEIYYLRRPAVPKFDYTLDGRTVTYLPGTSVQLEWNESELSEIMMRAIEYLGINVDDASIVQYANAKSKEIN